LFFYRPFFFSHRVHHHRNLVEISRRRCHIVSEFVTGQVAGGTGRNGSQKLYFIETINRVENERESFLNF
jgi:hypothetical protein